MTPLSSRTVRYGRAWIAGPHALVEDELVLDRDGVEVPASVVRPRGPVGAHPAWVVLHGITRPGRGHEQLVRFTRSVASAGLVAIVPEVPEWRELRLTPHLAVPTIAAAVRGLRDARLLRGDGVGVLGFSFGAPHAIAAAAHPDLEGVVAAAGGFGGYGALDSTFRFMMSGRHEWAGRAHVHRPDPYGRWIVAANYLAAVPEHAGATDVATALRELAAHAGDRRTPSWDPVYDPLIDRLRSTVAEERRPLFDLLAPRSDHPAQGADPGPSPEALAEGLAAAARRLDPEIDPAEALGRVTRPVSLLHGRADHLIPFTEAYRLHAALVRTETAVTVTRLFGHSAQDPFPLSSAFREVPAFVRALDRLLRLV